MYYSLYLNKRIERTKLGILQNKPDGKIFFFKCEIKKKTLLPETLNDRVKLF